MNKEITECLRHKKIKRKYSDNFQGIINYKKWRSNSYSFFRRTELLIML